MTSADCYAVVSAAYACAQSISVARHFPGRDAALPGYERELSLHRRGIYPVPWVTGLCCVVPARPKAGGLLCRSCSSQLGRRLPPDLASRRRPCLGLVVLFMYLATHEGEPPTGDLHPINSRPCRAYTRDSSGPVRSTAVAAWIRSGLLLAAQSLYVRPS
jgi:hypothetical protein